MNKSCGGHRFKAHLHVHTEASLLDGLSSVDSLVEEAKRLGYEHLAVTDHGVAYNLTKHWRKCKEEGLNPILGVEFYWHPQKRGCRELGREERGRIHHFSVLAKNTEGYKNLLRLSSISYEESSFYYEPQIDDEVLFEYGDGLIILSGCPAAPIPRALAEGNYDLARKRAKKYQERFGEDFYLEIQKHDLPDEKTGWNPNVERILSSDVWKRYAIQQARGNRDEERLLKDLGEKRYLQEYEVRLREKLRSDAEELREMELRIREGSRELGKELGIKLVATGDVHYAQREEAYLQDVVFAMGQQKWVLDDSRYYFSGDKFYLMSPEEMEEEFADFPEALDTSGEIAGKCKVDIPEIELTKQGKFRMPHFPDVPEGMTEEELLREWCAEGWEKLVQPRIDAGVIPEEEYRERLETELSTIEELGFSGYFLIVGDIVRWCKSQGIPVGDGRGSAVGSLVAFLVGITRVDPLYHPIDHFLGKQEPMGLLFERFIDIARKNDIADVDVDVSQRRRGEVIQYIKDKYGVDRVASIMTVGTMSCKAVLKKLGTAFRIEFDKMNSLTSLIPDRDSDGNAFTVAKAKGLRRVGALLKSDPEIAMVFELAERLEGTYSFAGVHPAGLIIADKPTWNYFATKMDDGMAVAQIDMDDVKSLGLLKVDILGLRSLDVLYDSIDEVVRNRGKKIDIENVPLDDPKPYELLRRCDVSGVFQVDTNLSRSYLIKNKPTEFKHIVEHLAIVRPGPLDSEFSPGISMADEFFRRKHGESRIVYPHPAVEDVLKSTYGILTYQEQIMMIAVAIAGFTRSESNFLRSAVAGKNKERMAKAEEMWFEGCRKNGVDKEAAKKIWDNIAAFGAYGFNLSHSVGYSMLTYKMAYMRTHYPVEFSVALLTSVMDKPERLEAFLKEVHAADIPIKPPSINISDEGFVADGDSIRFGLSAIKGVGRAALDALFTDRREHGTYNNYEEFVRRVYGGAVNKTVLEGLIKSGALDEFGLPRAAMLASVEPIIKAYGSYRGKIQRIEKRFDVIGAWDDISKIETEREKLTARRLKAQEELDAALKDAINQDVEEFPVKELAAIEKELLGYYAGHHPLDEYKEYYSSLLGRPEFLVNSRILRSYIGHEAIACGMVSSVQKRKGSNGWRIEALLEDWDGVVKVILFGRAVSQYGGLFKEGEVLTVMGRVTHWEVADSTYVRVDRVEKAVASGEGYVLVFGGAAQALRRVIEERCTLGDLKVALVDATGRRIDLGISVAAGEEEKIRSLPDVYQVLII